MAPFPESILSVTPEWLTEVLRRDGLLGESRVTEISLHPVGTEFGFLDSLARVQLKYDRNDPVAPNSVVIKLSAMEGTYRQIGAMYNAYEREFLFYKYVAGKSPIRTPRCYGCEIDSATQAYLLILEDLTELSSGNQAQGLTFDEAQAAIEAIGRMHAHWWQSPKLAGLAWMPTRNLRPARYQAAWPQFAEEYRGQLTNRAPGLALGESLINRLEGLLDELERGPCTIVHSDFRADNLLFDRSLTPTQAVTLDWQLTIRGPGVLDVARLLCGSLSPSDRAEYEWKLLARWHELLREGGVRDYSFEQAAADYRTSALICLYYPVTIHSAEEAAGLRGVSLAHAQIERFFSAALELCAN